MSTHKLSRQFIYYTLLQIVWKSKHAELNYDASSGIRVCCFQFKVSTIIQKLGVKHSLNILIIWYEYKMFVCFVTAEAK